jgi:hypothetical protein
MAAREEPAECGVGSCPLSDVTRCKAAGVLFVEAAPPFRQKGEVWYGTGRRGVVGRALTTSIPCVGTCPLIENPPERSPVATTVFARCIVDDCCAPAVPGVKGSTGLGEGCQTTRAACTRCQVQRKHVSDGHGLVDGGPPGKEHGDGEFVSSLGCDVEGRLSLGILRAYVGAGCKECAEEVWAPYACRLDNRRNGACIDGVRRGACNELSVERAFVGFVERWRVWVTPTCPQEGDGQQALKRP